MILAIEIPLESMSMHCPVNRPAEYARKGVTSEVRPPMHTVLYFHGSIPRVFSENLICLIINQLQAKDISGPAIALYEVFSRYFTATRYLFSPSQRCTYASLGRVLVTLAISGNIFTLLDWTCAIAHAHGSLDPP